VFNDHLFRFYIAGTERSRNRIGFDDDNGGIYDATLELLYPIEKGETLTWAAKSVCAFLVLFLAVQWSVSGNRHCH
jgi:hypothetical protein